MLYREIIAVCSQIHKKHVNALCGQNVELVIVKPGGTYSNHRALKG
jgi:RecB family endonuclease NucS